MNQVCVKKRIVKFAYFSLIGFLILTSANAYGFPVIKKIRPHGVIDTSSVTHVALLTNGLVKGTRLVLKTRTPNGEVSTDSNYPFTIRGELLHVNLNTQPIGETRFTFILRTPEGISEPAIKRGINTDTSSGTEELVAKIKVESPNLDRFLLRFNLPVIAGQYDDFQNIQYFSININGENIALQQDLAARDPQGRATIYQLSAVVPNIASSSDQDFIEYEIFKTPNPYDTPASDKEGAAYLAEIANPQIVEELLSSPELIKIKISKDAFDSPHSYSVLNTSGESVSQNRIGRQLGDYTRTARFAGVTQPTEDSPLDNGFAVQSYLTTIADELFILADFRFSLSADGLNPNNDRDNIMEEFYYRSLDISVPEGYKYIPDIADLYFDSNPSTIDGRSTFEIVRPLFEVTGAEENIMHHELAQGQFIRRGAIVKDIPEVIERAKAYLLQAGRGFATTGSSDQGRFYSFENPQTAYFFDAQRLPDLFFDVDQKRNQMNARFLELEESITYGIAGAAGIEHPANGPHLNLGARYGGATGADGIVGKYGHDVYYTASRAGLMNMIIEHLATQSRNRDASFSSNGEPSRFASFVKYGQCEDFDLYPAHSSRQYSILDRTPLVWENEKESYDQSHIVEQNRAPYYHDGAGDNGEQRLHKTIDNQHLIRSAKSILALVFLINDQLAKDDLALMADNVRSSWSDLPRYITWSQRCEPMAGSGLAALKRAVEYPETGSGYYGRAQAWAQMVSSIYYTFADDNWRADKSWFNMQVIASQLAQMPTGLLQNRWNEKHLPHFQTAEYTMEGSFYYYGMRSILNLVLKGTDNELENSAKQVLSRLASVSINPLFWNHEQSTPYADIAVADRDTPLQIFAGEDYPSHSLRWLGGDWGATYIGNLFTSAYNLTGNPLYIDNFKVMLNADSDAELLNRVRSRAINSSFYLEALADLQEH